MKKTTTFALGILTVVTICVIWASYGHDSASVEFGESVCGSGSSNPETLIRLSVPFGDADAKLSTRLRFPTMFTAFRFERTDEVSEKTCLQIDPDSILLSQAEGLGDEANKVLRQYVSVMAGNLAEINRGRAMLQRGIAFEIDLYSGLQGGTNDPDVVPVRFRGDSLADLLYLRNRLESDINSQVRQRIFEIQSTSQVATFSDEQMLGILVAARREAIKLAKE